MSEGRLLYEGWPTDWTVTQMRESVKTARVEFNPYRPSRVADRGKSRL